MPKVGDIIKPTHSEDQISFWAKDIEPKGYFCRIIWDSDRKIHLGVCNPNYKYGIIAFLIEKTPVKGDYLKVVSVGMSVCKVTTIKAGQENVKEVKPKSIPKYYSVVKEVIKRYEDKENEAVLDEIVMDLMEDEGIIGFDIDEVSELVLAEAYSKIWSGLFRYLKDKK